MFTFSEQSIGFSKEGIRDPTLYSLDTVSLYMEVQRTLKAQRTLNCKKVKEVKSIVQKLSKLVFLDFIFPVLTSQLPIQGFIFQ